jgi:HEPN domain-containing protein
MKLPDEALLLLVRQWIAKAEVNYQTAERLVRDDEPIRESIAFHCQQTAEKSIPAGQRSLPAVAAQNAASH